MRAHAFVAKATSGIGLLLVSACGGGSSPSAPSQPTGPPSPPPAAVADFVNGLNHGQAVSGLTVTVSGAPLAGPTGADGTTSSTIPNGAGMTVGGRSDYLPVQTFFSSAVPQFGLWHLDSTYDADYYKKLVYTDTDDDAVPGAAPMVRPDGGTHITVSIGAELQASSRAMDWINTALAEATRISSLTDKPVNFSLGASGGALTFDITPNDPAFTSNDDVVGVCYVRTIGSRITGGRIAFKSIDWAEDWNTALHETGHFMGFQHSRSEGDVMNSYVSHLPQFGLGETNAWVMMAQRKPGNTYPDNDPAVSRTSTRARTIVIVCR